MIIFFFATNRNRREKRKMSKYINKLDYYCALLSVNQMQECERLRFEGGQERESEGV